MFFIGLKAGISKPLFKDCYNFICLKSRIRKNCQRKSILKFELKWNLMMKHLYLQVYLWRKKKLSILKQRPSKFNKNNSPIFWIFPMNLIIVFKFYFNSKNLYINKTMSIKASNNVLVETIRVYRDYFPF